MAQIGFVGLGRIFFFAEFATAVAGWALELNPFDQPNVQEAKDNTKRVLAGEPLAIELGGLDEVLGAAAPPRYVAFMAYLAPSGAIDEAMTAMRRRIRDETGAATTFGYGPRFLHSTGQLHKGGPPTGLFVQIVGDTDEDVPVPGEDYSFGQLLAAQADGDFETLRSHDLTVVRVPATEIL